MSYHVTDMSAWTEGSWCETCGVAVDPFGIDPCPRCGYLNGPEADGLKASTEQASNDAVQLAADVERQLAALAWQYATVGAAWPFTEPEGRAFLRKVLDCNSRMATALIGVRDALGEYHAKWALLSEQIEQTDYDDSLLERRAA